MNLSLPLPLPVLGVPPASALALTLPPAADTEGAAGDAFLALVVGLLDQPTPDQPDLPDVPGPTVDPDEATDSTDPATTVVVLGVVPAPIVPPLVRAALATAPESSPALAPPAPPVPQAEPAAPAPVRPTDPVDLAPSPPPSTSPAAPIAPPATAVPATTAAPAAPAATHPITRQVFPEVVRVIAHPDGPRRVTVRLTPESLGEVRVVLTTRRGELEVRLTGGTEARRALTEGAPELQRLLQAVGHGDARITVRDLAGVPVAPPVPVAPIPVAPSPVTPAGTGLSADLAGSGGTGSGHRGAEPGPQDHPRGSSTPTPTTTSRHTESVTQARTGLDVTM